jgi:hypothetical protein
VPYTTLEAVRLAGITEAMASDDAVNTAILLWSQIWERMTKQWFEPREAVLEIDGTDSDTLHFPVAIIEVTEMFINNSSDALDPSLYRVYNKRGGTEVTDDRWNPRIKLIRDEEHHDVYAAPLVNGTMKFRKGRQNQTITGTWGFVEADGSTPLGVERAVLLLVVEKLLNPIIPPSTPLPPMGGMTGVLVEEETDGHRQKWQAVGGPISTRPGGLNGITQNPEVRDLRMLYRAPTHIATPANWTFDTVR